MNATRRLERVLQLTNQYTRLREAHRAFMHAHHDFVAELDRLELDLREAYQEAKADLLEEHTLTSHMEPHTSRQVTSASPGPRLISVAGHGPVRVE